EAIQLCSAALQTNDSSRPAIVLANLLIPGAGDSVDISQVESILRHAQARHVEDIDLLMATANLRLTAHKKEEAIQIYRQVLKSQPGHVAALNNLAVLLSEHPSTKEESLDYIDQAIELAGPQDNLLDTKAVILLQQNRTAEAAVLLERIATSTNADPRHLLHLAVARRQQGDGESAQKVF